MTQFLGRFSEYGYALMRIVVGYNYLLHGTQKLFAFPGVDEPAVLMSLRGLAGIIEFFGGSLITVGLFGSYAAFIASGEMASAYFISHVPRGDVLFPLLNVGERAVVYCFIFLYVASRGSGLWSLDRLIWGKK